MSKVINRETISKFRNNIKNLQNLYSWSEFYKVNQRDKDYWKCKSQIFEFKKRHNLK